MISSSSFKSVGSGEGVSRIRNKVFMDGMNVFSFGILKAPESINLLLSRFNIPLQEIDHFVFHQANMFLNEKIRKKLNIEADKVLYSLKDFGNTSSASIPLTLTVNKNAVGSGPKKIVACGFGVGLSWGSVIFNTDKLICSGLVEL